MFVCPEAPLKMLGENVGPGSSGLTSVVDAGIATNGENSFDGHCVLQLFSDSLGVLNRLFR